MIDTSFAFAAWSDLWGFALGGLHTSVEFLLFNKSRKANFDKSLTWKRVIPNMTPAAIYRFDSKRWMILVTQPRVWIVAPASMSYQEETHIK